MQAHTIKIIESPPFFVFQTLSEQASRINDRHFDDLLLKHTFDRPLTAISPITIDMFRISSNFTPA